MRIILKVLSVFKVLPALFICKTCLCQVEFSDGFSGTSIDTSKWTVAFLGGAGTLEVDSGFCHMQNGTAYPQGPYITSKAEVEPPARIVFRVRTSLDYSEGSYRTKAGFTGSFLSYSDEIFWGSSYTTLAHNGIVSSWKTDSIIWTSSELDFYVENSLVYSTTGGIPVDCEQAYFMIYMDQSGGGNVYDFWIDSVYMAGAECPGGAEEAKTNYTPSLQIANPIQHHGGRLNFSIPNDGYVSIALYDVIGRQVKILVNKEMGKGSHNVNLDGSLATGIYFINLEYKGTGLPGKRISKKVVIL